MAIKEREKRIEMVRKNEEKINTRRNGWKSGTSRANEKKNVRQANRRATHFIFFFFFII
jgi:hypothetical protein